MKKAFDYDYDLNINNLSWLQQSGRKAFYDLERLYSGHEVKYISSYRDYLLLLLLFYVPLFLLTLLRGQQTLFLSFLLWFLNIIR